MRTPRQETSWRPKTDLSGHFELNNSLLAGNENPTSHQTAYEAVRFMGLQAIADYDGYPDLQTEIIKEEARRLFPDSFRLSLVAELEPVRLISGQ